MTPINPAKYLAGKHRLPSGAVPMATDKPGSVLAVTPHGRWIRWWEGTSSIESVPPGIQKVVVDALVEAMGGTSATMAEALGISRRTVEAWRAGRIPLPAKSAENICRVLAR